MCAVEKTAFWFTGWFAYDNGFGNFGQGTASAATFVDVRMVIPMFLSSCANLFLC
jgi:hypothetical protein